VPHHPSRPVLARSRQNEAIMVKPAFSTVSTSLAAHLAHRRHQGLPVRITSPAAGAPQAMRWAMMTSATPCEPATSSSSVFGLRRASNRRTANQLFGAGEHELDQLLAVIRH